MQVLYDKCHKKEIFFDRNLLNIKKMCFILETNPNKTHKVIIEKYIK